jgi:hypothetical protein
MAKPKVVRDNTTPLDKYMDRVEKLAEQFKPLPPIDYASFPKPEPIRFVVGKTSDVRVLVIEIMKVLDGHTIEEIIAASNVVEQYVKAQSQGRIVSYPGVYGV